MYKIKIDVDNHGREEKYMLGFWDDEEVKALFNEVEKVKKENKPLKEAFSVHAKAFARKPNSVRNYYYHEIEGLEKDRERLLRLGIDLCKHNKASIVYFSHEEEKELMEKIEMMTQKGVSVRKACFILAEGDALKLLRYQNKYRNFISKKKQKEPQLLPEKVIAFQKPQTKGLSDSEVQSLFMGLVRLVKRNAVIEGEERAKQKLNVANERLKKTLLTIQVQAQEIEKMKERYNQLKQQNNELARNLLRSRCDRAGQLREKLSKKNGFEQGQVEKI